MSYLVFLFSLAGIVFVSPSFALTFETQTDLTSVGACAKETSLGCLVADALAAAGDVSIALFPGGDFREFTIPKGNVECEEIIKNLFYPDDGLAVIEITGARLKQALERSVSLYPRKHLGFLQVSGISFVFNPESGRGSRVSALMINGKLADPSANYRIAVPESLVRGAYGYFTVWGKSPSSKIVGKTVVVALQDFLSSRTSIDYSKLGRIVAKSE